MGNRPAFTRYAWPVGADDPWKEHPFVETDGLKWADQVGDLCRNCPLASYAHPFVKSGQRESAWHKLCTVWFLALGNGSLEEAFKDDGGCCRQDDDYERAKELVAKVREGWLRNKDGAWLHIFTVRGRPVALDAKGCVHAVEAGYFPVSSTGYRSQFQWSLNGEHPELTDELLASCQKALEKQAEECDKERSQAEKRAKAAIKKPGLDPVGACIALSGVVDQMVGCALFVESEDQERLLSLALAAAEKLAAMPCPETLENHVWKVKDVREEIDKAARQVDYLRLAIAAGNMLALAECGDFLIAGGMTYARLYREKGLCDCGHHRPSCPPGVDACPDCLDGGPSSEEEDDSRCELDRRRLRKAYLIGRDNYFIWRGHYRHAPECTAWGMTEEIEDAYRFASLEECLDYWRSRHASPEQYEHCIWDGYLKFFEETQKGVRRVMPEPPQMELF